MATTTPNIGLTLPSGTEGWKRSVINGNFTILDTKIGAVGNTPLQTQINTLSSQISNTFPLKSQSGYSTSQTIEAFLDTLPTNESWMTTITANGSTGDLVTVSSQHLFYIVQMAVGNSNNRFQLALAINTPKLYARAKLWWGTWTSWTLV